MDETKRRIASECLHLAGVQVAIALQLVYRANHTYKTGIGEKEKAYLDGTYDKLEEALDRISKMRQRTQG